MKNKGMAALLALMLCIGAIFLPVTVFAQTDKDTTPPTLSAKLEGETLHIEAADEHSGVEAVYIDGHRVNSLANGNASVLLKDYAGNEKQTSVYAVDFAGNRSETVKLDNPYYQAPAPLPKPTAPSTSQPDSSSSTSQPAPTPAPTTTTSASSSGADSSSQSSSSSQEDDSSGTATGGGNPFTPDGTGTVVDNATDEDGKEFYTITTADGNVFYLVIDNQRTDGNVYFLNAVTEADLMALAEQGGDNGVSVIPAPEPTPEPSPEPEPEPEPEKKEGGSGTFIFILLAAAAVGGAGYYLKVVKPRQQASFEEEDEFEDEEEFDEEYADELEFDLDAEPLPEEQEAQEDGE